MPRYYLDIREGEAFSADEDGIELENIAQAQIEAAALFADLSKEFVTQKPTHWGIPCPLRLEIRAVRCLR